MSDATEKFEDEFEGAATFLVHDCGMERAYAEDMLNELLRAHAGMLAEKVAADMAHIRYGSGEDYAERHAALIRPEPQP